jgi:NitT/TauT family transport system permease protein
MRAARQLLPPFIALAMIVALWEGLTRALAVPVYLLPPPSGIVGAAADHWRALALGAVTTAEAALLGFGLSASLGVLAAVVLSSSHALERALYPYTVFFQTVPIIAIAPLLVVWFGPGLRAVTISAFIVSVFPVIANTISGLRSVEPPLRDLFRLYGAGRRDTLLKLELPAALPNIVTGLRIASGLAVIGTIAGEWVSGYAEGSPGLGIVVTSAHRQLRTDLLFAAVVSASALGLGLFGAVNLLGFLLLRRWHPSAMKE